MSERGPKVTEKSPDRRRAWLWLFALAFDLFALRSAWDWVQVVWSELNNAAPTWSGQASRAMTEAGPLLIAFWQMAYLWRTLGSPFSRPRVQNGRAAADSLGLLWLFALVFGGLALRPAWYWVQAVRYELKYQTPSWTFQAMRALTEFGPLLVAICLLAFLWKVVGPPFAIRHSGSLEPTKPIARPEGLIDDDLQPPKLEFSPARRKSREAGPERERRAALRMLAWTAMAVLLFATVGWALLFIVCGGNDMFSLISTSRDEFERLSLGIMSVGGVILLSLILWAVIGPPFQRPPK